MDSQYHSIEKPHDIRSNTQEELEIIGTIDFDSEAPASITPIRLYRHQPTLASNLTSQRHQIRRLNVTRFDVLTSPETPLPAITAASISCNNSSVQSILILNDCLKCRSNQALPLPYPIPLLNLYPNFLFWYSFLPLFVFCSFDYTVKSGGVCNSLLALC